MTPYPKRIKLIPKKKMAKLLRQLPNTKKPLPSSPIFSHTYLPLLLKITNEMDKNQVLQDLADLIRANEQEIIRQNQLDLAAAKNIDDTLRDRLKVDAKKVAGMATAVEKIILVEDPVGKVLSHYEHPNGMIVENRVVPMGRILIIYESRPDVTIEATITAFKAGNRILLKGGKEARQSNLFLVELWHRALAKNDAPTDWVTYLDMGREAMQLLIKEFYLLGFLT